jgi:glutamate dehydrogenase/leucine dehydrogenase
VAWSAKLALEKLLKRDVTGATVAVQGFGNVGSYAARFLREFGAKVVALSDSQQGVHDAKGLDVDALIDDVEVHGVLPRKAPGDRITNAELLALDVDVLVPAAVENVLTAESAPTVRAKLVVEGANGPTTPEGDAALAEAGVIAVPDILANAGGVIASYIEWRNAKSGSITDRQEVFEALERQIERAFDEVDATAKERKISHRRAAECVAVTEVVAAMQDRGWI